MDVDLSPEDFAFQEDVRDFLSSNAHDPETDYGQWRMNWFELAKVKGGWDVPKWPVAFGGPGRGLASWPARTQASTLR